MANLTAVQITNWYLYGQETTPADLATDSLIRSPDVTTVASQRIFLFVCWVVALAGLAPARAQDWERLPDGRVVIEIEGVRLGLPTQEPDIDDIGFYIRPLGSTSGELKLRAIIASPDKARKLFADAHDISLRIPFIPDRRAPLLGRFDRSDLRTMSFGFSFGPPGERNCKGLAREFAEHRKQISARAVPVDQDGWAEFKVEKSPRTWTYIRAAPRADLPSEFDSIKCDAFRICGAAVCLRQGLSFAYSFNGRVFDRSTWMKLIEKAAIDGYVTESPKSGVDPAVWAWVLGGQTVSVPRTFLASGAAPPGGGRGLSPRAVSWAAAIC
jgi:hypothetical protein